MTKDALLTARDFQTQTKEIVMKKLGYFLAGNIALAVILVVGTAEATCPCRKPKPLPVEKEQKLYGDMAKQAEANKKLFGGRHAASKPSVNARAYYYQSGVKFPAPSHFISEIDPAGSMISIPDGSAFTIKESHQAIAKTWDFNTPLAIVPNSLSLWNKVTGSRPQHKYQLINLRNNQTVEATLSMGPYKHNPNARQILRLDRTTGEIYLNNGACYKVEMKGAAGEVFKSWKADHFVILGTNDTWFSFGNQFMVIDVNTDNWLPATRLY